VTDRALQADRAQTPGRIEKAGNPDDGVQFQQLERYRQIIEIDFPLRQLLQQISR
jgi:hypothetical protein